MYTNTPIIIISMFAIENIFVIKNLQFIFGLVGVLFKGKMMAQSNLCSINYGDVPPVLFSVITVRYSGIQ